MFKRTVHRPPHLLRDDQPYFITGAIHKRRRLLDAELKDRLTQLARAAFSEAGWHLEHWVFLDNHYHLIAKSRDGNALPSLIRNLHGKSGYLIR